MSFRVTFLLYCKQTRIYAAPVRHCQTCDPRSTDGCHSHLPAFEAPPGWINFEVFVGLVQVQRNTILATHQKRAARTFASARRTFGPEIHGRSCKIAMQQACFEAVLPYE